MLSDSDQQRDHKLLLFWSVYMLDISFSVRLGRLPSIRDHGIAVPMVSSGGAPIGVWSYSIELGRIQCEAVEQLCSPSSLKTTLEVRMNRTAALTTRLELMWSARNHSSLDHGLNGHRESHFILLRRSEAIMHYSTLALVQYAAHCARNDDSPALDAARHALRLSVDMMSAPIDLPEGARLAHCHWTFLHAPFTPFTVTFCNVIANPTSTRSDLRLLQDYVTTLKALSHLSEGVGKLYSLCDIFQKIADLYMQAKGQQSSLTDHDSYGIVAFTQSTVQGATREINMCLSTIGLTPLVKENCTRTSTENDASGTNYLD